MRFFANKWTLLITGSATLILTIIMAVAFSPLGENGGLEIVSLQFAFTFDRFFSIVDRWGETGAPLFRNRMWLDYLYPVVYSFFLAGLIFRKTHKRSLCLIPLVACAFDLLENTIHLSLFWIPGLLSPFGYVHILIFLASLFASAKWICILGSLVLFLWPKRNLSPNKLSLLNRS